MHNERQTLEYIDVKLGAFFIIVKTSLVICLQLLLSSAYHQKPILGYIVQDPAWTSASAAAPPAAP